MDSKVSRERGREREGGREGGRERERERERGREGAGEGFESMMHGSPCSPSEPGLLSLSRGVGRPEPSPAGIVELPRPC